MRTEAVCKGEEGEPVNHGGDDYTDDPCRFVRENSDRERLFSLDVMGIEHKGNIGGEILNDLTENIVRKGSGRYEVSFPWISGRKPKNTNEQQSRERQMNMNRKLEKAPEPKKEYNISNEQLVEGMIEEAPENPTGD